MGATADEDLFHYTNDKGYYPVEKRRQRLHGETENVKEQLKMIGGNDIVFPAVGDSATLEACAQIVERFWPKVRFEDAVTGEKYRVRRRSTLWEGTRTACLSQRRSRGRMGRG